MNEVLKAGTRVIGNEASLVGADRSGTGEEEEQEEEEVVISD